MAPPSALGELLRRDKDETAGIVLTALAITSWTAWYPGLSDDGIVHATARPLVERVGHRCITTTAEGISDLPDVIALRASFLSTDPATAPGWQPHFETNSLVGTALTMPVLVSQGLKDTLVRPDVTEAYVHDACVAGSSIELDTYPKADHFEVRTASAVKVRDWLLDRVHGTAAPAGCSTQVQA